MLMHSALFLFLLPERDPARTLSYLDKGEAALTALWLGYSWYCWVESVGQTIQKPDYELRERYERRVDALKGAC